MKKIIRLTESDLARIVKKVVREQDEDEVAVGSSGKSSRYDLKKLLDDRGKQQFITSVENYLTILKNSSSRTGITGLEDSFYDVQFEDFKRRMETLFNETIATKPSEFK
jgi:hypothetical protein